MIAVQDIVFVRYAAPDLGSMEAFLTDFGLRRVQRTADVLYMRASDAAPFVHVTERGATPRAVGFGLLARSRADLDALASSIGARVEDNPEPGGGSRVRCVDPAGFTIDVVHGQEPLALIPSRAPIESNPASGRRRFGQAVRLSAAPSSVVRLGHVALLVPNFQHVMKFYRDVFGFRSSDSYFAGQPDNIVASFLHCGLGSIYTDHHTVALISAQDGIARFDHSAFEVIDLDDVMQGNRYLGARGHVHSWGVGRHIQGSQIFDYWRDPFGNKIEHWTDGDLVNDDSPVGLAEAGEEELRQWAPPLPPEFFE